MAKILISSRHTIYALDTNLNDCVSFVKKHPMPKNDLYDFITNNSESIHGYHKIFNVNREYYGMSWIENRFFCTVDLYPSVIIELTTNGHFVKKYIPPCLSCQQNRTHQMLAIDRKLIVLSSDNDTIFRFDIDSLEWEVFYINQKNRFIKLSNLNLYHPNSMRFNNGVLEIMMLIDPHICNSTNGKKKSSIYYYSYPDMELIEKKDLNIAAHNIWDMDNNTWIIDSSNKMIRTIDRKHSYQMPEDSGWLRGVGVTDEEIIIGSSEMSTRKERVEKNGKIYVLDKSFNIKNIINLPNGNINDIRVVNEFDYAHGVDKIQIEHSF